MTYIFKCIECFTYFEVGSIAFQPPKGDDILCPDFGVGTIRIFTTPYIHYAGGGWISQKAGRN